MLVDVFFGKLVTSWQGLTENAEPDDRGGKYGKDMEKSFVGMFFDSRRKINDQMTEL